MTALTGAGWQVDDIDTMRLRMEIGQKAFFEGREFRTFRSLSIPAPTNTVQVIKAVVPLDIILYGLELSIDNGFVQCETVVGGVEGGAFSESLTAFPANTMSDRSLPIYLPKVVLSAGGTLTGGTVLDVIRLKVENASGSAASVGNAPQNQRGVGSGTYYFRLTNLAGAGATEGTFKARWEERP